MVGNDGSRHLTTRACHTLSILTKDPYASFNRQIRS